MSDRTLQDENATQGPTKPLVSVILAVRNEEQYIARSLRAIVEQDYPREKLEILVTDGMSDDDTREVVKAIAASARNVTLLENPDQIVSTGLNLAITRAKGDILVRVDGHTIIEPDYVRQCVAALDRSGAECVGGRMDATGTTPFGIAVALATSSPFGVGGARFHYSRREELVDTVYLGAWRRTLFERMGGFDEKLVRNQDDEFHYRLRSHGGRILLCPAIRSRYYNRSTPGQLARQYFQYGYWKVRVMQKHPRQMRLRQFVPPLFVAGLLVSLVAIAVSQVGAYLVALLAGPYLMANLAASWLAGRRQPWRVRAFVPVVFAVLHGAYGSGFLVGLLAFWKYWARGVPPPLYKQDRFAAPASEEHGPRPCSSGSVIECAIPPEEP